MTWDVVVTTNAGEETVSLFVANYRALGARTIHVYHDTPDRGSLGLRGVRETICSAEYWQGCRPEGVEGRQMLNARRAADLSDAEWLLHCDIDELLYLEDEFPSVDSALADLPQSCMSAMVRPVEAIYLEPPATVQEVFATPWFKARIPHAPSKAFWAELYGHLISLTNAGYWAHRHGKSFVRRTGIGPDVKIPLHGYKGSKAIQLGQTYVNGLLLRHYDAPPFSEWSRKHISRLDGTVSAPMMGDKRRQQAELIRKTAKQGKDALEQLFGKMYCVEPVFLRNGINCGAIATLPYRQLEGGPKTRT